MAQITANGLVFDYEHGAADGPHPTEDPVILLHGFPESAASWRHVTPRLNQAGHATYAPHQRGYSPGARPEGVEHYTAEHLTADVLALADAWELPRFHLVGHDWGAAVAWHLAAHHPDRLRTLTAVSVPHLAAYGWALAHDADQQRRAIYIGLLREPGKAEQVLLADDAARLSSMYGGAVEPELVDDHLARLTQPGALTAALNWYRAMTAELGSLPDVTVPTSYVWSTADQALGPAGAGRCGDHVTGDYRYVELEGISHWVPSEAPEALAEAVLNRIRS